jgi:hypothetical protein
LIVLGFRTNPGRRAGRCAGICPTRGNALAHLMHEFMPDGDAHSLSEFHSLSGFEHWAEMSTA